MNVITLKIPDELHAALQAASQRRKLSKSAVVREALEQSLLQQTAQAGAAERWVAQWRGSLRAPDQHSSRSRPVPATDEDRLAHLLDKHVR